MSTGSAGRIGSAGELPLAQRLHADVLVIGGGMAGAWAASAAARAGATVCLVDKGFCGTSGVTATAGPGHWWVPPEGRDEAIAAKLRGALGLAEGDWMARILDETWRTLPTLAGDYDFPRDEAGRIQYRGLRGPEYMRALRARIVRDGVRVLDHHPALELLRAGDGAICGARGWARQGPQPGGWQVTAGAVVLAAGGTSFRSRLLGAHNNTGDAYLMGAEAGALLSGLEFTGIYTIAPARTTMTRSMAYAYATYRDAGGRLLDIDPGRADFTLALARALLAGPVFCRLDRMPDDIRARLHTISPNVTATFARLGVDPYTDDFEVTLHADGTIRGTGGLRVADADCGVGVDGLYAAGDAASRERIAGAVSGGGAQNSAWALSSGVWAGRAAARFARARGLRAAPQRIEPLGQAGLRPAGAARGIDAAAAQRTVQAQMLPYERNLWRSRARLAESQAHLEVLWRDLHAHAGGTADGAALLRQREAAALAATARWSLA
ncbi:MAG: FAD-binding protein, partial [Comamonas sp.]